METIINKSDFPKEKIRALLSEQTIAILGYGVQGRAQALNLKDQGFPVIVGQRAGTMHFQNAVADGWREGENLFDLKTAAQKANTIYYLLSDSGQAEFWPTLKPFLTDGKTLVFAHGFAIVYAEQTGVVPPQNIDVILVAPKGSGVSMRQKFVNGVGFNASIAVQQDFSGKAREKALAHAFAIGAHFIFETNFVNEVRSDLVSERGIILGGLMGMMEAQFNELRQHGHSPSEAFNDTVEEVTEWLARMVGDVGFDGMLKNCSQTAQWGALKWRHKFREALEPVFKDLYSKVASGEETAEVLKIAKNQQLQNDKQNEIAEIANSELWQTAKKIRELR